ncbi:MAG: hypothetical protein JW955_14190, partial [Sedimentisphaerales bacterium]|nr:hypothetical protein [Sedimentisphaerales bacterium]
SGRTLEKLMTYERWIENSLYRSFNELHRLRREQEAVKQSQTEEVSSSKCEVSRGADADPPCETKPMDRDEAVVGAGPCARPGPGADPGQPQGVAPTNAKQSQSPDGGLKTGEGSCETKPIGEASSSTPALGGDPSRGRLGYMAGEPRPAQRSADLQ